MIPASFLTGGLTDRMETFAVLANRELAFRHVKQPNSIIVLAYNQGMRKRKGLPESLRPFFWDYRFSNLSLPDDKDLVIRRILSQGSWQAIRWLRKEIGDTELREWLISHQGRGLSPRQLRYWELIYALPPRQVNQWVQNSKKEVWAQR